MVGRRSEKSAGMLEEACFVTQIVMQMNDSRQLVHFDCYLYFCIAEFDFYCHCDENSKTIMLRGKIISFCCPLSCLSLPIWILCIVWLQKKDAREVSEDLYKVKSELKFSAKTYCMEYYFGTKYDGNNFIRNFSFIIFLS